MSATKVIPVVGVTFVPTYPQNLITLARVSADQQPGDEALSVVLLRNPANPHDANAVEVHVPALPGDLGMIGHVSRDNAARLAPLLDAGIRFRSWIAGVRINPTHMDRPGIDVAITRAETRQEVTV